MINCKHIKQCLNRQIKCKLTDEVISSSCNRFCKDYEPKPQRTSIDTQTNKRVLNHTKKPLRKVSKKREFVSKETYNQTMIKCNNRCVLCGTSQQLQLHHINGRGKDKTNNIDNCVMLCTNCHLNIVHKSNKYWREQLNKMEFRA